MQDSKETLRKIKTATRTIKKKKHGKPTFKTNRIRKEMRFEKKKMNKQMFQDHWPRVVMRLLSAFLIGLKYGCACKTNPHILNSSII